MTEHLGISNEDLASAFIVDTCQLIPRSSLARFDLIPSNCVKEMKYIILSGSRAEFYIQPLIACVDDLDFLVVDADELVFSGDFPVLPSDLGGLTDTIKCYKIESHDRYPRVVRLRKWGEMNYNWKFKKYEINYAAYTDRCESINMDFFADGLTQAPLERIEVCGPAITSIYMKKDNLDTSFNLRTDIVPSMWCPHWPKEAQGWLNRLRVNGWPTTEIMADVVQHGCHLVYIQHRSCRNDTEQRRFSFSCAEIILLQSWTQTQQIVYHLLRFFAKRELIQKDCPKEDEVLCTYHLKTLMLWTCEEMPPEWWTSSSVIAICSNLLKMLAEWLQKKHCPNYFIPEANLFHNLSASEILEKTERRLNEFRNSGSLCHWFEKHYIWSYIRRVINPIEIKSHFMDFKQPIIDTRKMCELKSVEFYFCAAFNHTHSSTLTHYIGSAFRQICEAKFRLRMRDLPTIQNVLCFKYHDNLLHILCAAYSLSNGFLSCDSSMFVKYVDEVTKYRKNVRSQYHNFPTPHTSQNSWSEFLHAQGLMENLSGSNSRTETKLLILTTKEILQNALKHVGTVISNGIAHAVEAYLAALHFATSEYQEVTRLCSAVLVNQTSIEDKEALNAGCLLFIDDVARIIGLCVLQKKTTENNLHYINRRLYLDLRLSPEVLAQYLTVLSAEKISKESDFYQNLLDSSFPMDVNLNALIKQMMSSSYNNSVRHNVCHGPDSLRETEVSSVNPTTAKERVFDALMECAVENMTLFYNLIRKDYGVICNTADCYRALYLYKCRQYDQVLHLCEQILKASDLNSDLKEYSFANVLLFPPLDSFFDRDVQSLLGFKILFHYFFPLNGDLGKNKLTGESTFEHWSARDVYYDKSALVPLPENLFSFNFHYYLGRHFLAKYLKIRCYVDRNLPYSEALTEFAVQNTNFPLEHIILRFLRLKLRRPI